MYEVAEDKVEKNLDKHNLKHDYTDADYDAAVAVELPVFIGKVDCVEHPALCQDYMIRAYPTLKMFVDGEEVGDYRGHRTVVEMAHFIEEMEKDHKGKDRAVETGGAKDGEFGSYMICNSTAVGCSEFTFVMPSGIRSHYSHEGAPGVCGTTDGYAA